MSIFVTRYFEFNRVPGNVSVELQMLKARRGNFFLAGTGLVFLGLIAIGGSIGATFISVAFLGWVLLIAGIVHSVQAFSSARLESFGSTLLSGLFYAIAGIVVLRNVGATAITLTYILAPAFMIVGASKMISSVVNRFPHWGWSLIGGFIELGLGLMIWNQLPTSGLWLIGTLLGVELLFNGVATIAFGFALRSLPNAIASEKRAA